MNDLVKFIPLAVLLYGLYGTYGVYEEHQTRMTLLESQVPQIQQRTANLKKKIHEVEGAQEEIDEFEQKISDFKLKIDDIKRKIPPLRSFTTVLDELSNEAKRLNIKNITFKPKYKKENHNGVYYTNGIEFTGEGTYLQFLIFYERLGMADRIFNVKEVKLENPGDNQTGRHVLVKTQAVIESFFYNEDYEADKTKKDKNQT